MNTKNILIAVDDSEATAATVTYVGQMLEGVPDVQVFLVHIPAPIPPKLLEFGGTENPEQEQQMESRLAAARTAWIEKTTSAAQPLLTRAYAILRTFDIPDQAVATQVAPPLPEQDLTTSLLDVARSHGCGTVVVGRASFSWFRELVQQHVADKLVQESHGLTIWVVQSDADSAT